MVRCLFLKAHVHPKDFPCMLLLVLVVYRKSRVDTTDIESSCRVCKLSVVAEWYVSIEIQNVQGILFTTSLLVVCPTSSTEYTRISWSL